MKMINKTKNLFAGASSCNVRKAFGLFASLLLSMTMIAQNQTVKGVVKDQAGETLLGVSVTVVGQSTTGTITDLDGAFQLSVDPAKGTLHFSYIGYKAQSYKLNGQTNISVVLVEDSELLGEVVVVGYGTQKKVNLSGSVSSIKMDELVESRPVSNISQGLSGMAAGVSINSASNRPGENNADITIRGQGTLNSSAPLVIIDGTEGNINSVTPQDIESMSILKDAASSAIYGSRAANGVILITTKKGKAGAIKIDYNGYLSWESTSKNMEFVSNYADFMGLINEGFRNSNPKAAAKFSDDRIKEWRDNPTSQKYPNTDVMDEMFQTSLATNHNISVSGGSEKIRFFTSFGYLNSPGVMENSGFEKFSARANMEVDATSWLKLGTNINGYYSSSEPGTEKVKDTFDFAFATTPGMVLKASDGRYGAMNNSEDDSQASGNNPFYRLNNVKGLNQRRNIKTRFYGTLNPIKGFTLTGSFNYDFTDKVIDSQPVFIDLWNFYTEQITKPGKVRTSITNKNYKWNRYTMDVVANYENKISKLDYKVMVGANQELFRYKWFEAQKYDLIDPELSSINGAAGDSSASGSTVEWAMQSYFGRINLGWEDKYLFEFNLRADGSSRFQKDNRWGYFPSGSAAWRIDQEPFMKQLSDTWLSNLKLRGSYGVLGNNVLDKDNPDIGGNYDSQARYSQKYRIGTGTTDYYNGYILNNSLQMGVAQSSISNSIVTWEKTYIANIGLDFGLLNNRLTGTAEYFHKKTTDILIDLPAPLSAGAANIPSQNVGEVVNKGVELSLGWQDKVQDVSYFVSGNATFLSNKVTKFQGEVPKFDGANMTKAGYAINTQFVHVVDRLVQTQADLDYVQSLVDKHPDYFKTFKRPQLGDLLYTDSDGSGILNDDDRQAMDYGTTPKFVFGFNFGAAYKGFDFSVLLQGATGVKTFWNNNYFRPLVRHGYQISKEIADGRWYEGMEGTAKYPRLLEYTDTRNTITSDFWVQNRSYLKIRNIQLGYTLPKSLLGKVGIDKVRLYGSLENFFTFSSYDGLDPELSKVDYPPMKQAVLGVNVSF